MLESKRKSTIKCKNANECVAAAQRPRYALWHYQYSAFIFYKETNYYAAWQQSEAEGNRGAAVAGNKLKTFSFSLNCERKETQSRTKNEWRRAAMLTICVADCCKISFEVNCCGVLLFECNYINYYSLFSSRQLLQLWDEWCHYFFSIVPQTYSFKAIALNLKLRWDPLWFVRISRPQTSNTWGNLFNWEYLPEIYS